MVSSSGLTVAPLTVRSGLFLVGCWRRSFLYRSIIWVSISVSLWPPKDRSKCFRWFSKAFLLDSERHETCDFAYSSHSSSNVIRSPGQPTLNNPSATSASRCFQILVATALLVSAFNQLGENDPSKWAKKGNHGLESKSPQRHFRTSCPVNVDVYNAYIISK